MPEQVKKIIRKSSKKRAKKRTNFNLLTLIMFILPPVGFLMMWSKKCTWTRTWKYAASGLMAAAIIALFVIPSPTPESASEGGVHLVGVNPSAEIYGPELPTAMVTGYTTKVTETVFADDSDEDDITYVYAAKGAKCYHLLSCKFAYASAQKLTVYEAYYQGYTPCGLCNPPEYGSESSSSDDTTDTTTE